MKKGLAMGLVVLMLVSMLSVSVFADGTATLTVGKGKQFETLEAAFAEAIAKQYTDITYEIYGLQRLNAESNGDGKMYAVCAKPMDATVDEVHFVGKDAQAGIFLNDPTPKPANSTESDTTYLTAFGTKEVTFSNLTINHNKESAKINGKGDRVCSAWYIYSGDKVTYTDCVFKNIVFTTTKNEIYQNCDFINQNTGSYALFYSGNNDDGKGGSLVIDGCNFVGTRAVKTYSDEIYNGSRTVLSALTVTNSNISSIEKAGIENTDAIMAGAKVTIAGNIFHCKDGKAVNDAASLGITDEEIKKNNEFDTLRPAARISYTATDVAYEKGTQEGEVVANAYVTNNLTKASSVVMVTAEYSVAQNGTKSLVCVTSQAKEIGAGATEKFETSVVVSDESNVVQTMFVAADTMEPIVPVGSYEKEQEESLIYISTEIEENDIPISVYKVNRFEDKRDDEINTGENETPFA